MKHAVLFLASFMATFSNTSYANEQSSAASEESKVDLKKKNIQIRNDKLKEFAALPTRQFESETTRFPSRSIYLNGVNVSTIREESLENVKVEIDRNGNILITAPHYEVTQDSSYHPLLQSELPKFPREQIKPEGMPSGTYSKKSGQKVPAEEPEQSEPKPDDPATRAKEPPVRQNPTAK